MKTKDNQINPDIQFVFGIAMMKTSLAAETPAVSMAPNDHPYLLSRGLALLRILMGWIFLWAFVDKLFGLGFSTAAADAWIRGGSPTAGFLTHATSGPFAPVYQAMAGNPVVDALFMFGLLGIGFALILGIGLRVAAVAGATLMVLMYLASLTPANNPVVDDHIVYAVLLVLLAMFHAGRTWGLGKRWETKPVVQHHRWLE